MRIFAVCAFIGAIQGEIARTTETRETASSLLSRAKRFFWEEMSQGNLERECIEEVRILKVILDHWLVCNLWFSKTLHATKKKTGKFMTMMNSIEKAGPNSRAVSPSLSHKMYVTLNYCQFALSDWWSYIKHLFSANEQEQSAKLLQER